MNNIIFHKTCICPPFEEPPTPATPTPATPTPATPTPATPTPATPTPATPTPEPPSTIGNSANYNRQANWNGTADGNVTTVGSNGGPSAYGTYDMSGNVFEWNDLTGVAGSSRGLRGGNWGRDAFDLSSSDRYTNVPSYEFGFIGFRLASRYSTINPLNLPYFVNVGDINNANDATGYGGVNYTYQIGKYTVTNCEYVEFLNAVANTDTYGLYNNLMNSEVWGGITRSGSSGSFTYSVKANMGNKPVIHPGWFDCARYCNWLHNGKPSGGQDNTTTEDGAYTLNGKTTGDAVAINANANYHIPTENEWYKAAYYKGGGTDAGYWTYATQSDTAPTPVTANSVGDGMIGSSPARVTDYVCPAIAIPIDLNPTLIYTASNDDQVINPGFQRIGVFNPNNDTVNFEVEYSEDNGSTWVDLYSGSAEPKQIFTVGSLSFPMNGSIPSAIFRSRASISGTNSVWSDDINNDFINTVELLPGIINLGSSSYNITNPNNTECFIIAERSLDSGASWQPVVGGSVSASGTTTTTGSTEGLWRSISADLTVNSISVSSRSTPVSI